MIGVFSQGVDPMSTEEIFTASPYYIIGDVVRYFARKNKLDNLCCGKVDRVDICIKSDNHQCYKAASFTYSYLIKDEASYNKSLVDPDEVWIDEDLLFPTKRHAIEFLIDIAAQSIRDITRFKEIAETFDPIAKGFFKSKIDALEQLATQNYGENNE